MRKASDKIQLKEFICKSLIPIIPVIIIAIIFMVYNYVRFGNPLEFGHNYLPEFTRAQDGQFSFVYLLPNLKQLFANFITFNDNFKPNFPMPFAFYIANPLCIAGLYRAIKDIVKTHKISYTRLIFLCAISLNIVLICLHRTLGAWQFGARYTCDILPFVFLCMLITRQEFSNRDIALLDGEISHIEKLDIFEIACIIFGIILNFFGVFIMWKNV